MVDYLEMNLRNWWEQGDKVDRQWHLDHGLDIYHQDMVQILDSF